MGDRGRDGYEGNERMAVVIIQKLIKLLQCSKIVIQPRELFKMFRLLSLLQKKLAFFKPKLKKKNFFEKFYFPSNGLLISTFLKFIISLFTHQS